MTKDLHAKSHPLPSASTPMAAVSYRPSVGRRLVNAFLRILYTYLPTFLVWPSVVQGRRFPLVASRFLNSPDASVACLVSRRLVPPTFHRAAVRVPAYRTFLSERGIDPKRVRTTAEFDERVPQTRRDNYILPYSIRERCVDGCLPSSGAIDESAGTTGDALNWVRSARELASHRDIVQMGLRFTLGYGRKRPTILINTLSCGPWAGGFRLGTELESWCLVKNSGPDPEQVFRTLKAFGTEEHYLLAGYPPFLKELVHFLKGHAEFELGAYRIDILTGGEGFPEGWRQYMEAELRQGASIVSAYGASDLETGVASETPYSIAILKLMYSDSRLRMDLLGTLREPVFFGQYNPSQHYIRSSQNASGQRELEFTVLGPYSASPRIKYCVGDEGDMISFERVRDVLRERHGSPTVPQISLPFMYILGRTDGTVSLDGANIYPETVAAALVRDPVLAEGILTFKLGVLHPALGPARLAIYLRANRDLQPTEALTHRCKKTIMEQLLMLNSDFRESFRANPNSADPLVTILPYESELFAGEKNRVKQSYFLQGR